MVQGEPGYVVEIIPKDHVKSEYSRFVIHVEKDTCVPLLTRYWDDRGLLVKELTAPSAEVVEMDGVHWPGTLTMRNLQLDSFTTLTVLQLEPNPGIDRTTFDLRRLESESH